MNSKKVPPKKTEAMAPALDLRREENFTVKYANHVTTEPTGWDLKVSFGHVDPSVGPDVVFQHTAISLPWPTVKSLIYILRLQLVAYEKNNGHVPFPVGGMAPIPRSIPEQLNKLPNAQAIHAAVLKLYDEFVAENPEAFPNEHSSDLTR